MPQSLKVIIRLLIGFAALAVVLVAALLLVALNMDPNQYKEQIATVTERQIGHKINIEGEIKLDLFPVLSLDVARVSIDNPAPFEGTFALVERASAQLKLWPLLQQRLEIGKITLIKPQIALFVAADGRGNWEGNLPADVTAPGEISSDLVLLLSGLSLAGISITDASVLWRDKSAQEHVQVNQLNLEAGAIASGEPTAFSLQGSMLDHARGLSAGADIAGAITLDPSSRRVNVEDMHATGSFQRGGSPAVDIELAADVIFDLGQDQLLLKQANAGLGEARIELDGSIGGLLSLHRTMDLKVSSNTFDLHDLAKILAIELPPTRDGQAFRQFAVSGDLAVILSEDQATATIRQSAITLDDSHLQMQGDVTWVPALQIALTGKVDHLDAARYLPPKDEAGASAGPLELPVDNLHADVTFRDGRINILELAAMVFGGKVDGDALIETGRTGASTKWSTQGKASGVDLARVATSFFPENTWSPRGAGDISWQLRASGDDMQTITGSLEGSVRLSVSDGGIRDPELAANIERIVAFLERRPRRDSGEEVVLDRADANFDLKRGIAENRDLRVDMPLLRAHGEGDIDLVSSSVDYRIQIGLCSDACKSEEEKPRLPFAVRISGPFDDLEYALDLQNVVDQVAKTLIGEEEIKEELEKKKEELLQRKDRVVDAVEDKIKDKVKEGIDSILGGKLPFLR